MISIFLSPLIVLVFLFLSLKYAAEYKWQKPGLNVLLGVNKFLLAAIIWQVHETAFNFHIK